MSGNIKRRRRSRTKKNKGLLAAKYDLLMLARSDPNDDPEADFIRRHRIKKNRGQRPPRNAPGFIYFVEAGPFVKIGWSSQDATSRIADMQTGCPYEIKVLGVCRAKLTTRDERALHDKFRAYHFRGEWFHLSEEIRLFVQEYCRRETIAKTEASISHNLYPSSV